MTDTPDCTSSCPVRKALKIFEGKYSASILRELLTGRKRFSELLKSIPGISSKTLSGKLKEYTSGGIVERHSYPEIPPKVEYCLTEKGAELEVIINELRRFGAEAEVDGTVLHPDKAESDSLRHLG